MRKMIALEQLAIVHPHLQCQIECKTALTAIQQLPAVFIPTNKANLEFIPRHHFRCPSLAICVNVSPLALPPPGSSLLKALHRLKALTTHYLQSMRPGFERLQPTCCSLSLTPFVKCRNSNCADVLHFRL